MRYVFVFILLLVVSPLYGQNTFEQRRLEVKRQIVAAKIALVRSDILECQKFAAEAMERERQARLVYEKQKVQEVVSQMPNYHTWRDGSPWYAAYDMKQHLWDSHRSTISRMGYSWDQVRSLNSTQLINLHTNCHRLSGRF